MLYGIGSTKHGRFSNIGNMEPMKEHNREILREIVKEYLYRKGRHEKTYKEEFVPVYDVAPYGQVMFAEPNLLERTVNRLEKQVGEFYMSRIEVKTGAEFSETEARARRIVASWK